MVSHASTDDQQTQVPAGIEAFVVYEQSKSAMLHAVAKTLHSVCKRERASANWGALVMKRVPFLAGSSSPRPSAPPVQAVKPYMH